MEASFDFSIHDMSLLRRWWCVILVENFGLEGYGKKFAHYSEEGRATLSDNVPPTFRISRKRTHAGSTMMPLDTDEDHSYNKRPCSFLPKESESHVTMDKEDGSLDGENASFKMLEERAQQAQHHRRLTSGLLIDCITQDKGLLQHLEAIVTGQVKSPWAKKDERVIILFEDDDQVDRVLSFLSQVVEKTQTERRFTDEVAFVMDVLLPEATVHALAAVLSVSLERAKETYKCGPEYDWSEMELCSHYLTKNMSEEAHQRLKDSSERF
ncbi:PWWP domain-containing DNA repair factor 3B-like [Trematomus bernacchii]|uniref:PWWP domain-containing DNA repair factor 3B-like n=1 Tax=Trematomus bernacchii TaxID=40690 RepID=UPI00146BA0DF|nr:PWWP domain-containing DNA repair factor 3B-like [Trematomus bernacchii]